MSELTITDVAIRQDSQNRYCLNDLHKAAVLSGANKRTKEPAKFLLSPQTIDLIRELTDTQNLGIAPVNVVKGGNSSQQGTYVAKELVYSYAMWINATFHINVIRAYDALVTGEIPEHIIKAYDELVAHKIPEFPNIITEPVSVFEFETRYAFHDNALENLKNAQIIISAKDFLSLKRDRSV